MSNAVAATKYGGKRKMKQHWRKDKDEQAVSEKKNGRRRTKVEEEESGTGGK